jgi:hypothetical protein
MLRSLSASLLWRGLLAVAIGIVAILWPGVGVALFARPDIGALSLAEVFGIFSIALGVWGLVLAASTHATGSRLNRLLRPSGLTGD